MKLAQALAKFP